eukprot:3001413-Prymnesium_polylepis.1
MFLGLTFLVLPSTSTRIFRTFLCERIDYGNDEVRHYLSADLATSCDTDEYQTTRIIGFAFVAVWPMGIPVLYAVLLWANRN